MSIVGTLKKTEAKVAELRGELEHATAKITELNESLGHSEADREAAVKAHGEAIAAKDEEIAAKVAEIEKAQADMKEQAEKAESVAKELSDAKAQCEKLEQALADPAYVAAAATGEKAVDGSGEAGSEGGSLIEKMNGLANPLERAQFYKQNKAAIDAEAKGA